MFCERWVLLMTLCATSIISVAQAVDNGLINDSLINEGRKIYQAGELPNGELITAVGAGKTELIGSQASCANCHKGSGLGGVEGNESIPPITGDALFGGGQAVVVEYDKQFNKQFSSQAAHYDDKTLANAIRLGKHITGRKLSHLMPHYTLTDGQIRALSAYLKTLSKAISSGVDETSIHLATVITPNVSEEKRAIYIRTLTDLINNHNVNVSSGQRQRIPPIERKLNSRRKWSLAIWDLHGPSSTWGDQLIQRQNEKPVFALLSGLSDEDWQPVASFCENNKVPCWFPSIENNPDTHSNPQFNLYFSKGIALDAEVLHKALLAKNNKPHKIIQIINHTRASESAADILHQLFNTEPHIEISQLYYSAQAPALNEINDKLKQLNSDDVVIAWLPPDELNPIVNVVQSLKATLYLSSSLFGEQVPKDITALNNDLYLIDKLELPTLREANLLRFKSWLKYRDIPLIDEKMQSEVYFAYNSFSWIVSSMLNNYYTDYLIERAEAILSMRDSMQVQEEVQSLMMGGGGRRPQLHSTSVDNAFSVDHLKDQQKLMDVNLLSKRESSSIYPRISLGNGQLFASKGAYVRKFNTETQRYDEKNAQWIVP